MDTCRVHTRRVFFLEHLMAASEVAIANLALSELGQEPISEAVSAITDIVANTKFKRHLTAVFGVTRDEVLRAHPWNFASKRVTLAATEKTISGATAANPVVITATSHGFSNGDYVIITDVVGMTQLNGNRYKVADKTTHTFELQTTAGVDVDGSAYTAYASAGTATKSPAWGHSFLYALPSDFLALAYPELLTMDFRIEGGTFICSEADPNIEYIAQITTVTLMDPLFVSAFAALLAARLALPLTGRSQIKQGMETLYRDRMAEARFKDSREAPVEAIENFTWLAGRLDTTSEGYSVIAQ
jgi:hypothetical protein